MFLFISLLLAVLSVAPLYAKGSSDNQEWQAGVARVIITPEEPVWMAGYAARQRPSEGTLHDLWARALALQDREGKRVLLITTDLLGFPKKMSDNIRDRLLADLGLERSSIILSSSHTHSGPVLMDALFDIYPISGSHIEVIKRYSEELENKIIGIAKEAMHNLEPADLFSGNGVVRFQVNRRNNNEAAIESLNELKGPNDFSVPVIKVADRSGYPMAVVFGYACHTTVLNNYLFSGDYAGFAQIELEKLYPGTTAMFFQGAGADQNPLPRRTMQLAQQYGKELAAAVERVLNEEMPNLLPFAVTAYSETNLPLSGPPTREELIRLRDESSGYQRQWAITQLETMDNNGKFITSYPYPVQIWKLGDQPLIVLGGEPVVEYALMIKRLFGNSVFVMGYANDVMGYIPTETILLADDYEGMTSQMVYGLPGKWIPGIQDIILNALTRLAEEAGVDKINQNKP